MNAPAREAEKSLTVTSRDNTQECFVYITPPGETKFVTAGRFVLTTDRQGIPTGRFVYGRSYLARDNAVPIDPLELKLGRTTYRTTALKGIFGALRDAGPDYWGRRVIEKHAGQPELGELDYLLYAPDDRAGALGFGLNQKPLLRGGALTRRWTLKGCNAGRRDRR